MRAAWILKRAGKSTVGRGWDLCSMFAKSRYYSSLKKMRAEVERTVLYGEIPSVNNFTQENWQNKEYCVVINSGGCGIFSFQKIYIN